jgi:hypothetical protein
VYPLIEEQKTKINGALTAAREKDNKKRLGRLGLIDLKREEFKPWWKR